MNYPKTIKDWAEWLMSEWKMHNGQDEGPKAFHLSDFKTPPEFIVRECEQHYRKGYSQGFAEAVDLIWRLYKKGFVRPTEISNILGDHWDRVLMPWRYRAGRDVAKADYSLICQTPNFKHKSWPEIREEVLKRDHRQCCACGSTKNLEIDHIEPVAEGGLPTTDNLQVLCSSCHRGVKVA